LRQHEGRWVVAGEWGIYGLHARRAASAFTIAPIQDHVVVDRDRVEQAMLGDIGDEPVEFGALN
jgi:hypothetical protein